MERQLWSSVTASMWPFLQVEGKRICKNGKLTVGANFVMNIWAGLVFVMNSCLDDGVQGETALVLRDGHDVALPRGGGERNLQKWK